MRTTVSRLHHVCLRKTEVKAEQRREPDRPPLRYGLQVTHIVERMSMDREEKRIAKALGTQEVREVDEGNLLQYRKYLLEQLAKGTVLTGREDFPWEEQYVFASGNRAEYERLKKETHRIKTNTNSSAYLKKR
jgi:hypothetical protein